MLDSEYERDLRCISESCREFRVVSGSAGLASEIPEGIGLSSSRPTLTVCGSMRTTTRNQMNMLERHLGVEKFTLREDTFRGKQDIAIRSLGKALDLNKDVAIITSDKHINLEPDITGDQIVTRLAEITAELIGKHEVSGIIMTGGATSLGICEKLGVNSMEILGEVRPGIPLLKLSNGIIAITKAGGFGDDYSLIESVRYLRRMRK